MQLLEVSGVVRLIYRSLGVKGLKGWPRHVSAVSGQHHTTILLREGTPYLFEIRCWLCPTGGVGFWKKKKKILALPVYGPFTFSP